MGQVRVRGELMGLATGATRNGIGREVVRVTAESRPRGPADNAIILVDRGNGRGRYLSWIGYFDLDCAAAVQPGRWSIVDPATLWERDIDWNPFGHSGNERTVSPTWNGGPTDGLVLPRDGGAMRPARQSRYRPAIHDVADGAEISSHPGTAAVKRGT
jgi:hypothetical protein